LTRVKTLNRFLHWL